MKKPSIFSVLLALGALVTLAALTGILSATMGPAFGLGTNENFLLFRLWGMSRSATLKISVLLLVVGGLIAGLAPALPMVMAIFARLKAGARKLTAVIQRRPVQALGLFLLSVLLVMASVLEIFDLVPQRTQGPYLSPDERALRFKEHLPKSSLVTTPTDEYISEWTDSLEQRGYAFAVDGDGFIEPSAVHAHPDIKIVFLGGSSTETLYVDPKDRFPYLVGRILEGKTGLKINSYNGGVGGNHTMHANLLLLGKVAPMAPRFVVLMEASNDLSMLRMYQKEGYWNANPYRGLLIKRYDKAIQQTASAWDHLTRFFYQALPNTARLVATAKATVMRLLGKNTKDPGEVDEWAEVRGHLDPISEDAKKAIYASFQRSVMTFVSLARIWKINPVLMTQATRVTSNPDPFMARIMPSAIKKNMNMTYETYRELLDGLNDVIRDIARNEHVYLIDLNRLVPPTNRYIYDMVHFNGEGSKYAAEIIANHLVKFLEDEKVRPAGR